MQKVKSAVRHLTDALKLPPRLQPRVPLVELIGRSTLILTRHHGLTEYTTQTICARTSEGMLTVTGTGLSVTQMNAETLTVCGRISGVSYAEDSP